MQPVDKVPVQPWMQTPATRRVLKALGASGGEPRFAGGCVRDAVLGLPAKDIDIAIGVPPDEVMRLLRAAGIKAVPTGIDHGTVTAVTVDAHFEITTLRTDVETFGRHARVAFTDDWMADAARRDFTINAMFAAPDGTLYDPFGGLADLRAGRVRFVGDAETRIREDVLRLLRFFRFHAYYGRVAPDPAALAACAHLAHLLPTLSGERLAGETLRLLAAPEPAGIVRLMAEHDVLRHLLPEAVAIDRLAALVAIERWRGETDALRRLAALLVVDEAGANIVADRLRLSNQQRARLHSMCVAAPPLGVELDDHQRRHRLYDLGAERYRDLAVLAWAAALAASPDATPGGMTDWAALVALADTWTPPEFPLRGRDLLARGMAPGPPVSVLLNELESWWIDGDFVADREACVAELDRRLARSGAAKDGPPAATRS